HPPSQVSAHTGTGRPSGPDSRSCTMPHPPWPGPTLTLMTSLWAYIVIVAVLLCWLAGALGRRPGCKDPGYLGADLPDDRGVRHRHRHRPGTGAVPGRERTPVRSLVTR